MEETAYQDIIEKYIYDKPLSPSEIHLLTEYLRENREQSALQSIISKAITEKLFEDAADSGRADIIFNNILNNTGAPEIKSNSRWTAYGFWRVAASILLVLGISLGIYEYQSGNDSKTVATKKLNTDALPGTNKAYLKLANGDSILLTQSGDGMLVSEGGAQVSKQGGQLSYKMSGATEPGKTVYNTLNIPRGGKFQLVLADGSKVWMNSASSIRFPTTFTGKERRLILNGEAYFEVAKNKAKPFIVETNGMEVKVLGTHFNVSAYHDEESIKTTLVEGSVQVSKGNHKALLSPGKQSTLNKSAGTIQVAEANLQEALAWKNELFVFKNADIKAVMRQLSRWYDMDVVYKGDANTRLNGMISRNTNLLGVIKLLQISGGAKFKIDGKLITVSEVNQVK
jgi:hypothetical protein